MKTNHDLADAERERLAMISVNGRPRGSRDSQPRGCTPAVLDSIHRANALQTPEIRSAARMKLTAERRREIARAGAKARWEQKRSSA
jgi:hypothetical protein